MIFPNWLKRCVEIRYVQSGGGFGGGAAVPKTRIVVSADIKINKKKNNIRVTAKYLNMRSL